MADTNERVMNMVRRELDKDPSVPNEKLLEKAVRIDPSLSRLTTRQFHAKYPLQVKRAKTRASGGARKGAAKGGRGGARKGAGRGRQQTTGGRKGGRRRSAESAPAPQAEAPRRRGRPRKNAGASGVSASTGNGGREGVRAVLLQFAREVAAADQRTDLIDVVARMDGWVDQVMQQAGR